MKKQRIASIFLLLSILFAMNWIVGVVVNPQLSLLKNYASEFAALNQPYRWIFGVGDVISALMLLTFLLIVAPKRKPLQALIPWLIGLFALITIADALFPLACPIHEVSCRDFLTYGPVPVSHIMHVSTSIGAAATIFTAMAIDSWTSRDKLRIMIASGAMFSMGVSVLSEIDLHQMGGIFLIIEIILVQIWILLIGLELLRERLHRLRNTCQSKA